MKQATKLNQVMLLIKSLSKAEKRYIRLYTNLQNGDKHYMVLYDLACEGFSAEQIYEKFCGKVNEKSFEIPYGIEISKHTRFRRHQRERTGKQTNAD